MKNLYIFSIACCFTLATFKLHAQAGTLDNTFGTGGKVTTSFTTAESDAYSIAIQPDGKIIVAGYDKIGINFDFAVARYNTDGSLDNTFGTSGKVITDFSNSDDRGHGLALQTDGKILVIGQSNANGTDNDYALVRYNSNGTLDNTFGAGGIVLTDFAAGNDYGYAVAVQADGKIVVTGQSFTGSDWDFGLARYNTNGTLDATFGTNGKATTDFGGGYYDYGYSIAIQSNGKIVVAGSSNLSLYYFATARYNTNGILDGNFGTAGLVTTAIGSSQDVANAVAIQADHKIIVAGYSTGNPYQSFAVVRYDTTGSLDNSFGTGGKVTTVIGTANAGGYALAIQNDGKIIVAGHSYAYYDDFTLVRYNTDGTLDNTFGNAGKAITNFTTSDDGAFAVALQTDGKIVAAGISNNGSVFNFALARYNGSATGIAQNNLARNSFVYPNPNNGIFTINTKAIGYTIVVTNLLGEIMLHSKITNEKTEIDLSNEAKGIYFVKLFDGENYFTQKVIVQ